MPSSYMAHFTSRLQGGKKGLNCVPNTARRKQQDQCPIKPTMPCKTNVQQYLSKTEAGFNKAREQRAGGKANTNWVLCNTVKHYQTRNLDTLLV